MTNRLRTEGTDHLVSAAQAVGVRRFVAQGISGAYARNGGPVKTEEDPLDPTPAREMRGTIAAIRHLEEAVLGAGWTEGIVLRYGAFYGPGTSLTEGPEQFELIRKRKFPVVGDGGGVWSFVHVADAAEATSPRSSAAVAAPTMWSTTIPPRSLSGYRRWLSNSAPRSRCACRDSSGGYSPVRWAW